MSAFHPPVITPGLRATVAVMRGLTLRTPEERAANLEKPPP